MRLKSILVLLLILGFLASCTFPGALRPVLGFLGAAIHLKQSVEWKGYLPLVIKSIPPPITQTPTRTATSTFTPTRTATPVTTGCALTHNGAYEQQLYVLINNERTKAGLELLTVNNALEISAGWHSDDMAINHFMSHTGSDGSTFWERAVRAGYTGHWGGEIIVGGSSPESAVEWWMSDAPHRDMILGDLDDFGAGYAHCSSNYFTVDFGHR